MPLTEAKKYTSKTFTGVTEDELRDSRILAKVRLKIAFDRFEENSGASQWLKLEDAMRLHQGYQKNAFRNQSGTYSVTLYIETDAD